MARNHKKKLPSEPQEAVIDNLSHDGRGVARINEKTVFIAGALPGERVSFLYTRLHRNFDEGRVEQVLEASAERVEPRCAHFDICGGCTLQHLEPEAQIRLKQQQLLENFKRLGKVSPQSVLEPLRGPHWGYRRKARMGVRYVDKKGQVLVGFREKGTGYLAMLERCEVLHPSVGARLKELAQLIEGLKAYRRIAQIEVAVDDSQSALVFRNLEPLDEDDMQRLRAYAQDNDLSVLLQPKGPESVQPLWPQALDLHYRLPAYELTLHFRSTDFTQVNADINRRMIERTLELLDIQPSERILDLFCGLGNFTLPLARRAREVVGVEGDEALVERARENARGNGIDNAEFHAADLSGELEQAPWWQGGFDKVLLDPPRSGALETLQHIAGLGVKRLVYVSCNPATLARDAGELVHQYGYRLECTGVMDMFPHTAHVESIALFIRA